MTTVSDWCIVKESKGMIMGKRQEAAKLTRQNIVRAAERLHESRGLSNVSVDEIVAEAGVSKGTFYVYFKRKEDVAFDIAFRRFGDLKDSVEHLSGSAFDNIETFLDVSSQYIQEQGVSICKEWMKRAVSAADSNGMLKLQFDEQVIREQLERAVQSGELAPNMSVDFACDSILAEYYGYVTLWAMTEGSFDLHDRVKRLAHNLRNTVWKTKA